MNPLGPYLFPIAPVEAAILGTALVVIVFGVPAVIAAVRLPRQLEIVPITPAQLSPDQRAWFEGIEAKLRVEGYSEALTFSAPNLPSENLSRAWTSDSFPAMVMATVGKHETDDTVTATRYIELVTEFADGSGVTTRSGAIDDLFDLLPGARRYVHRYVSDPIDLMRLHEKHCAPLVTKEPVHHGRDEFGAVLNEFHGRWVAHQVDRGLLADTGNGDFRPSVRLALRGIRAFFNPFEEEVDLRKLVAVLLGGFALPLVASLALIDARVPVVPAIEGLTGLGAAAALAIAMAPVMWSAGAVVGWIIPNNTFVWPAICAWASSRVLLGEAAGDWVATGLWLFALATVPVAANKASLLRSRWRGLL